ncbi:Hypothetical protein J6897_03001 [Nakaseomyces glabratus]|nr:hypothetical protein LTX96_0004279 [Nakaseomyces glabratus]
MSSLRKDHAIMVPCHSIWNYFTSCSDYIHLGQDPEQWFLAPFQYEGRDHLSFIKHGLAGLDTLLSDFANSTLIFSGSQTKAEAGPVSEAQSYQLLMYRIIKQSIDDINVVNGIFGNIDSEILKLIKSIISKMRDQGITLDQLFESHRITLEEYALDSFDNLLYSLGQFQAVNGNYPKKMTIVGFGFKQSRYLDLHAKAIDFKNINYISIEPSPTGYNSEQLEVYFSTLSAMEKKNAAALFQTDYYGRRSPLLDKKQSRNPFNKQPKYEILSILKGLENYSDEEFLQKHIVGHTPW